MNSDLEKTNDVGDRARIILSEIVESYLNKGTPVSSKIISRTSSKWCFVIHESQNWRNTCNVRWISF